MTQAAAHEGPLGSQEGMAQQGFDPSADTEKELFRDIVSTAVLEALPDTAVGPN